MLVRFARPVFGTASRFSLGSWVDKGRAFFTDGHWGFRLPVELPDGQIDPVKFREASKPVLTFGENGELSYAAPKFEITTPENFSPPNIEASFSKAEKEVESIREKGVPVINPAFLLAVAQMAVDSGWTGIKIFIPSVESGSPVYFEGLSYSGEAKGAAIIMPMRF